MGPAAQKMTDYESHTVNSRLGYFAPSSKKTGLSFAQEIASSMARPPRSISPKFFYDERGSLLFEEICRLPEYYLTRTETALLGGIGGQLSGMLPPGTRLVELGSGSSVKTRLILDMLDGSHDPIWYVPIDISGILRSSCARLLDDYPALRITGIIDTYDAGLDLVRGLGGPNLIAFLGSSLGNFDTAAAAGMLGRIRSSMGDADLLLIGLDLAKDPEILRAAYDDPQGVTARFNLNVLYRINRELGGDFDPARFSHAVTFDRTEQRIGMYLRSETRQSVTVRESGLSMTLGRGEMIHTEYSHKYTIPQIRSMMYGSGFGIERIWQDDKEYYALVLCSAR